MVHLNINSLQNKLDELKAINEKLKASIIILTETKIDGTYPNSLFCMTNYRLFRNDRTKGGGGVMAYVKAGIAVRHLKLPHTYKTLEAIALDVNLGNSNCVILGIYRPPRSAGVNYSVNLEDELNSIHSWALSQRQSVITLGDLNLDKLKPNSTEGKILGDIEDIFQLKCLIEEATRITTTSRTLIDVILTNKPELFDTAGVIDFGLSDHAMIYGFLKPKVKHHPAKVISFRSTKNLDPDAMRGDLNEAMTALELDNSMSAQEQYNRWHIEMIKVLDKHMPVRKMRVRERDAPYITREWKEAIRNKRKYAKHHKKLQTEESGQMMRKWRNIASHLRRNAIKQYWREKIR